MTYGIDVSHWQKNINWEKVRERRVIFAFIKATEGGTRKDPFFNQNWEKAGEAGVIRGAYHYFNLSEPKKQADNFIKTVFPVWKKQDLPPAVDVEFIGADERNLEVRKENAKKLVKNLIVWLQCIEDTFKVIPVLYTYPHFWTTILKDVPKDEFARFPLWISHYIKNAKKVKIPKPWTSWTFWQRTDKKLMSDALEGFLDVTCFSGDLKSLKSFIAHQSIVEIL